MVRWLPVEGMLDGLPICLTQFYSRSVVLSLEAVLIGGGVVRKTLVS
jgi:hypothetical protein